MPSNSVLPFLVAAILAIPCEPAVAQSGDPAPEAPAVESPIQPSDEHPFYWEYEGEPVVLIGGSDDDNLFQWTGDRLTGHLDSLAAVGGNYVRNTMSDRDEDDVYAFAEVEEGVYDLDQWNEEYWDRLAFFLQETSERGIIVQLTLWDHFDFHEGHPWHPESNVNYGTDVVSDEGDFFGGSVLQENEELLVYQRRFVDKILSISLRYGNVLYNINNEGSQPRAWDHYWASYLQKQAAEQGREMFVTTMKFDPSSSVRRAMTDRDVYAYAEISQNNQDSRGARGPAHYSNVLTWRQKLEADPMPMNNVKIYGSGAGENNSAGTGKEATARLWKNVFAGAASARFHRPEGGWGIGLNDHARAHLEAMSMLLEEFDVFDASPHPDLLSSSAGLPSASMEAYCLAEIGAAYAVYFPEGRYTIELDPWVYADSVRVRWLDIEEGTWSEPEVRPVTWEGGLDEWGHWGRVRLTTPSNGAAVALVEVVEMQEER
jgi:hypothetical protein